MRILIIATGYPRWPGDFTNIYLHRFAKALIKIGVKVFILTPHAPNLKEFDIMDSVFIYRFKYIIPTKLQSLAYFPGIPEKLKTLKGKLQLPFFLIFMAVYLVYLSHKLRIDVINAHWAMPCGLIAVLTRVFHRKPIVITLYGAELFPLLKSNTILSKLAKFLLKYTINSAEKVVGISDKTCEIAKIISKREDIQILPDGIDTEFFNPKVPEEIRARILGDEKGKILICSSGRMVERKGFRYLIEALPYILKKCPNVVLALGGDGPERKRLETLARKLGIEEKVKFLGFIPDEDFPKFLKACDVFILPSIVDSKGDTEGSATILLEAMACETPVVGTNVGGIPYAIKDGVGGFLVPQKNPKAIADAVLKLIENPQLMRKLGKEGRRYVEKKFSINKIARIYKEIFKKVSRISD